MSDVRPAAPPAVVLLSGGLDSAVTAAVARAEGFAVHALTLRYGQRHAVEVDAARRVARALGAASHVILDVDLRALGGSALTTDLAVPKDGASLRHGDAAGPSPGASIPVTYVPARNTIFLGLALAHAEVLGARDIFLGISSVDYSGYPDCRPEFLDAFEKVAALATRAGVEGTAFQLHAPLLRLSKADTVRRAAELGVDLGLTHSCYDPAADGAACGECDSCRLRRDAFKTAGLPDPTPYAATRTRRPVVRVLELIRTLQGESSRAGTPCVLIRLAGCPLQCSYCDTSWARDAEGEEMTIAEIVASARELGPRLALVTGGEPLAQAHGTALLRALADAGFEVLVETSGALDARGIDARVRRILDVKTPGSGMADRNAWENLDDLRPTDELKFVLTDRADYEWARTLVRERRLADRCTVLFSPVADHLPAARLAQWILDDGLPVRLNLQLHRILWPDRERGV